MFCPPRPVCSLRLHTLTLSSSFPIAMLRWSSVMLACSVPIVRGGWVTIDAASPMWRITGNASQGLIIVPLCQGESIIAGAGARIELTFSGTPSAEE